MMTLKFLIIPFDKWQFTALYLFASFGALELTKPNNLLTHAKFNLRKYLYFFVISLFSFFVLYLFQYADRSNPLLKSFDSFLLTFADN